MLPLKTTDLEKILSTYKVVKSKKRRREAESISMPFMLTLFNEMIKKNIPPKQEEFIRNFKKTYPKYRILGITDRLRRAYASYIREYHLGYVLKDVFKNKAEVIYTNELDLAGVDYVIKYRDLEFNLHAFIDTERGRYWRKVKNTRHNFQGIHLDVPLSFDNAKRCGDFLLYTEDQVKRLKRKMDSIVRAKNKEND